MATPKISIAAPQEDSWDLGLSELIEEAPVTSEDRKTRFREEDVNQDGGNVVMLRQRPSWLKKTA